MTGDLSADGLGTIFTLRPNETATLALTVASEETFTGGVRLRQSDNRQTWPVARDSVDALVDYALAAHTGTIGTHTIKNDGPGIRAYRVEAYSVEAESNAVTYTATEEVDIVDAPLDEIVQVRDDGVARIPGGLLNTDIVTDGPQDVPFDAGNFTGEGSMVVTAEVADQVDYSYEYLTDKLVAVTVALQGIELSVATGAYVSVALPSGMSPSRSCRGFGVAVDATNTPGSIVAPKDGSTLRLYRDAAASAWTVGTNRGFYGQVLVHIK